MNAQQVLDLARDMAAAEGLPAPQRITVQSDGYHLGISYHVITLQGVELDVGRQLLDTAPPGVMRVLVAREVGHLLHRPSVAAHILDRFCRFFGPWFCGVWVASTVVQTFLTGDATALVAVLMVAAVIAGGHLVRNMLTHDQECTVDICAAQRVGLSATMCALAWLHERDRRPPPAWIPTALLPHAPLPERIARLRHLSGQPRT